MRGFCRLERHSTSFVRMAWLSEDRYRELLETAAIPAVDILPARRIATGVEIGLILRDDAEGGRSWNLVGGRILRGESVADAASRHLASTLGDGITWRPRDFERPDTVGEYMPERRQGYAFDPRKHAIALSYVIVIEDGLPEPRDEAFDFRWWSIDGVLPSPVGFDQEPVIRRLLPFARKLAMT